ncbi:hypothetical protein Bpfe_025568 [Biomphalaria pfeifferi]|uniref:Uncharacterized protein n=1 Tax=Biomphalaria pfeifferi TaxID=112525 RepID=A0AAD8EYT0_BIOPF|nr:hypothetical protein Bpfe_025568 [Biomphalaria pfeifferi]
MTAESLLLLLLTIMISVRCTVGCSSSREALTLEEEFMVKQMRSWGFSSPDHRALKENQRIIDLKFKLARLVDTITDELEKKKREQEARAKEAEMKRRYEQCRGSWFIRACLERGTNIRGKRSDPSLNTKSFTEKIYQLFNSL